MSFVGDKSRKMYLTFQWNTAEVGPGDDIQQVSEKDILDKVTAKFKEQLASKKIHYGSGAPKDYKQAKRNGERRTPGKSNPAN